MRALIQLGPGSTYRDLVAKSKKEAAEAQALAIAQGIPQQQQEQPGEGKHIVFSDDEAEEEQVLLSSRASQKKKKPQQQARDKRAVTVTGKSTPTTKTPDKTPTPTTTTTKTTQKTPEKSMHQKLLSASHQRSKLLLAKVQKKLRK